MAIIELENVHKSYQMGSTEYHALRGISLNIENNEFVALVGASGSGKTTTMQIMGLLSRPTQGEYRLLDHNTNSLSSDQQAALRNHHIGFVFQTYFLLPRLTALENVMLPLRYRNFTGDMRKRALETLEMVEMDKHYKHKPNEMSGGQQQRIAIARALVGHPSLILADEPTGALDSRTGEVVMQLLLNLQREHGNTVIIVTHDSHVAEQCQRRVYIQDGQILKQEYSK